jgi:hypothetical protein
MIAMARAANCGLRSCTGETLIDSVPTGQWRASRQAWAITQSPSASISPISSATGMNTDGGTLPISGCCQRISASTPTTAPFEAEYVGW